jgi:hypothetical protein
VSERLARGLLDTSVVVDLNQFTADQLPVEIAISAITLAELSAGPMATNDHAERARRQDRLQRIEAAFDPLPFGVNAARAYGLVHAAVVERGRQPTRRFADLLIASIAVAEQLPLLTRNADLFLGLDQLISVVAV